MTDSVPIAVRRVLTKSLDAQLNKTVAELYGSTIPSRGVQAFGPLMLAHAIVALWKANGKPVVSVGSGTGLTEALAKTICPEMELICVDPNAREFMPGSIMKDAVVFQAPDYPLVTKLLAARPELKDNCNVVLIWALPNDAHYDMDAIKKLKPLSVLAVMEPAGGAGSSRFHQWNAQNDGYTWTRSVRTIAPGPIDDFHLECLFLAKEQPSTEALANFDTLAPQKTVPCVYVNPEVLQMKRMLAAMRGRSFL